jgi:hypothetical protein
MAVLPVEGLSSSCYSLARYTYYQVRSLDQRELCERHIAWLKANRPNAHDLRNDPDG